ncbi:hypothetical protein DFJ58DRAFT_910907 [Suillus subalutaceus]|uniref:uncharacterized protein n=1 Tax=Suillus subalutaceus TaxID=48586 RepID=UPI001B876835|nr:uncharacterized protein DFJ58DRAFT_910907 [Suillus subalutaceus]KAG1871294.1 hypothetical protein DFJ58DRAFT_910907 [Suillus subalutaceus]
MMMDGLGHQNNKRKHAQYDLFPGDHDHELDAQRVPSSPTNKRKVLKTSLNCTRSSEVSNYLTERKLELSRVTRRVIAAKARLQRLRSLELELIKSINDDELEITKQELTATDFYPDEFLYHTCSFYMCICVVHGLRVRTINSRQLHFGGPLDACGWTVEMPGVQDRPESSSNGIYGIADRQQGPILKLFLAEVHIELLLCMGVPDTPRIPRSLRMRTGDELGGPIFGDMWVPNEWTEQIAVALALALVDVQSYVKELAPIKLVIDGTRVNATHLSIPTVEILSDHLHSPDIAKLQSDISLVQSMNKAYIAGEHDRTGSSAVAFASSLPEFLSSIEASPIVSGDLFWGFKSFMHDVPDCTIYVNHTDSETLQYGNPENTVQTNTKILEIR